MGPVPVGSLNLTLIRTPEDFQIIDIFIGGNGHIKEGSLSKIRRLKGFRPHKGVVLFGKAPCFLYAHLAQIYHSAIWTAVYSPQNDPVIVASRTSKKRIGDVLDKTQILDLIPPRPKLRHLPLSKTDSVKAIAFIGPPHSGKSVLLNSLRVRLRSLLRAEKFQRDFFILRACPDGEGDWFHEGAAGEVEILRFKNAYSDDFVTQICRQLEMLKREKKLLFVDVGGLMDRKNQAICSHCTHALIVSSNPSAIPEWRGFARASGLSILAEIQSSLRGKTRVLDKGTPLRCRISRLVRHTLPNNIPRVLLKRIIQGI
jgi:CRISPR-associated protein Csx3